jgi:hypothetical protein
MKRLIILLVLIFASAPAFAQSVYYSSNDDHPTQLSTAANVLASSLGGTATPFNASGDAEWATAVGAADIILVGQGALGSLSVGTVDDITTWTNAGGVLITLWSENNLDLLNAVSGASMTWIGCCGSGVGTKQPETFGTSFDSAPDTINLSVSNTVPVLDGTLPGTALAAYTDTNSNIHVMTMGVGSGSIAWLSWDWCCGDGAGDRAAWDAVLLSAATYVQGDVPPVARFNVTKEFTNGYIGEVDVTLTCNGGLPLEQSFTISSDDPAGVTFTVTDLPGTGADCEVTESGGPDGYTNNADACSWTGVTNGLFTCEITNTPEPSEFAVEIDFDMIEDPAIDLGWDLTVVCTPAADAEDATSFPGVTWNDISGSGSYMNTFEFYADPVNDTDCKATLSGLSSAIEEDGPCTIKGIVVGEADDPATDDVSETPTCTITATAFYEGIPTLSQYGLALMALLMLGVGFIGFRRFV